MPHRNWSHRGSNKHFTGMEIEEARRATGEISLSWDDRPVVQTWHVDSVLPRGCLTLAESFGRSFADTMWLLSLGFVLSSADTNWRCRI